MKRKRKQLLVEMKQGAEQSSGMMDYVDPLRALEAMGARDIKVGRKGGGGEDGRWNTRERERGRALHCVD